MKEEYKDTSRGASAAHNIEDMKKKYLILCCCALFVGICYLSNNELFFGAGYIGIAIAAYLIPSIKEEKTK